MKFNATGYLELQSFLSMLERMHCVMNPENIVEDALAISRLLIAGSSSCLLYNFEKLNSITICPSEL